MQFRSDFVTTSPMIMKASQLGPQQAEGQRGNYLPLKFSKSANKFFSC